MRHPKSIIQLAARATQEKIEAMRHRHYRYNPKPFYEMTDMQAKAFAARQAIVASGSMDMTEEEMELYAGAIYGSIKYFNDHDERHAEHMVYLQECASAEKDFRKLQREIRKNQQQTEMVIY